MSLIEAVQESEGGSPVQRVGTWVMMRDESRGGLRHIYRANAVLGLSDLDESRSDTVIALPGGRAVVVPMAMERVAEALEIP